MPRSHHVYGGKAALCFEEDSTRGGTATVRLEAALATAPRAYDWNAKIGVQFTQAELPVVAAVLLGHRTSCEFSAHGPEQTKGFSMERQGNGRIFVKVFEKGQPVRAVPMEAPDAFYVSALVVEQLMKAAGTDNPGVVQMALRVFA